MNEKETLTKTNLEKSKEGVYKEISTLLQKHECDTTLMLTASVAALCNVDVEDMMKQGQKMTNAHARWLLYYALRYMKNCTNEYIANITAYNGVKHTDMAIRVGVNRMSEMISREPVWRNRWETLKHLIKQVQGEDVTRIAPRKQKVVISVPRDIEVEIKKEK